MKATAHIVLLYLLERAWGVCRIRCELQSRITVCIIPRRLLISLYDDFGGKPPMLSLHHLESSEAVSTIFASPGT